MKQVGVSETQLVLMRQSYRKTLTLEQVFFFQAECGIRALVRSRGLGDVYKRQLMGCPRRTGRPRRRRRPPRRADHPPRPDPPAVVSYTHLTLPTTYSV